MTLYFQGYCKQDLYRLYDTKMGVAVQFLVHERSKILGSDFSRKLAVLTQTEFCREFPRRKTLCRKSITKTVEKFRATRTVGFFPRDFEILGWCSAGSVLPHGEKVPL